MDYALKRQKSIEQQNSNCGSSGNSSSNNNNKHIQIQNYFRMECPNKGGDGKDKDKDKAFFSPRIREVESNKGKPKLLTGRLPEAFSINKAHSPDIDNNNNNNNNNERLMLCSSHNDEGMFRQRIVYNHTEVQDDQYVNLKYNNNNNKNINGNTSLETNSQRSEKNLLIKLQDVSDNIICYITCIYVYRKGKIIFKQIQIIIIVVITIIIFLFKRIIFYLDIVVVKTQHHQR
jgi:hypothetical protein